eukprot:gene11940-25020_t
MKNIYDSNETRNLDIKPDILPKSIYLGGCGWCCAFYVGVYQAMVERWGCDFQKDIIITGDSSGAAFSLGIALGISPEVMESLFKDLGVNAEKEGGVVGKMGGITNINLEFMLSDANAYLQLENRFAVGVTRFPFHHTWYKSWTSNQQLLDCLHGSMHIPVYYEYRRPVDGQVVIDGAFSMSGEHFIDGNDTLYIGIHPYADIGPSRVPMTWQLLPLPDAVFEQLRLQGYQAMKHWDGSLRADKVRGRRSRPMVLIF